MILSGGGWSYAGRKLYFGVREHAMGAILNGLAAYGGTLPFGATFLIFLRFHAGGDPPRRVDRVHVIYVFTHDSITGRRRVYPSASRAARRPAFGTVPHRHVYRDSVLPPSIRARLAVEAGVSQGWHRYYGDGGDMRGFERFGASVPGIVMMREYGFTVDNVCRWAMVLLHR